MMEPGLKAQWVEALRSGRYRQAPGSLHQSRGYCCLGVLAIVARMDLKTVMSYEVFQDLGLTEDQVWKECVSRNDGGETFAEIADYIEKEL